MPCVFAPVSEVPTPSRNVSDILQPFNDLRDSMRHERVGSGGRDVCEALTIALDRALVELMTPLPSDVAIVALGGYGRRELSPFSDIDLMVLHEVEDAGEVAANLFRPLWDARFRVGHSVRTKGEAAAAARERFDNQTTLLTSRLVAGDPILFDGLMEEVAAVTRARPLRRHLVAEERRRRESEPHLLMAADVKEGRGGLRTLQAFEWERRREALIGRFAADPVPEEEEARETLLAVRNGLHLAARRAHDVFSTDLRDPAARWLGSDLYDTARALVSANQTVDRLASSRWPEVVGDLPGPLGKRMWSRLVGRPDPLGETRAPTIAEINWLLESGARGQVAFERLWQAGLLDRLLPEWESVRCEPQLAPFHEHPVDEHLWRTVEEMQRILGDGGRYQEVGDDLDLPEVLLLCAFLHDIGKGHGGDHANVGADIAVSFCSRLQVDPDTVRLVEGAVRHHLLLSETATRRDLDDPAVIEEVASAIGEVRLLQVIYLLTVADSRATGATMWSDWKATLVADLVERCLGWFAPAEVGLGGPSRAEVVAAAATFDSEVLAAHVDRLPADYLRSLSPEDVVWHVELVESLQGRSGIGVRSAGPVETAVVVGEAGPSFRQCVTASFAANGIDVLEARMFTRQDGIVVDSFQVHDDRTGGAVRPERWDRARSDLEQALRGEIDAFAKVEARAAAYPAPDDDKPVVRCAVDPATGDVVVAVRCADRIGRLAQILHVIGRAGLDVRLAKLDSRGDQLVDTFHVRTEEPVSRESLDDLARLIAGSITP